MSASKIVKYLVQIMLTSFLVLSKQDWILPQPADTKTPRQADATGNVCMYDKLNQKK